MSDLAKRLRSLAGCAPSFEPVLTEAVEEIERLREENAKLREALESYLKTVNLLGHIAHKLSEERRSLEPLIPKPPAVEGGE
jgi:exonuclease VII small subunit